MDLQQRVLRTDVSGMPLEWVGYQDAVRLITLGQVSYSLGKTLYNIHGGINALSGQQSMVSVNAIIATQGQHPHKHLFGTNYVPPLSNQSLFRRDQSLCLYCGKQFPNFLLSRDHVHPSIITRQAGPLSRRACNYSPSRFAPPMQSMSTCRDGKSCLTRWTSCWHTSRATACYADGLNKVNPCWFRPVLLLAPGITPPVN